MPRMTLTLDGIYRAEENETIDAYKRSSFPVNYTRNQYTARLRANYRLQRYVSVYALTEYTIQESNRQTKDNWDRFLVTVGLSLRY